MSSSNRVACASPSARLSGAAWRGSRPTASDTDWSNRITRQECVAIHLVIIFKELRLIGLALHFIYLSIYLVVVVLFNGHRL